MNKTKLLRSDIQAIIGEILEDGGFEAALYYDHAPSQQHKAKYVIFSVEEVTKLDERIAYELEINCNDYGEDTEACENMADAIAAALDHSVHISESIAFYIYANRRNNVRADDEKIVRRRLTFDLYLYEWG